MKSELTYARVASTSSAPTFNAMSATRETEIEQRLWHVGSWMPTITEWSSDNATVGIEVFVARTPDNQSALPRADRYSIQAVMAWTRMWQMTSARVQLEFQNMARQVEQDVLQAFVDIGEVALIYFDRLSPSQMHQFTVFIKGDSYDRVLMDNLLDREYRVLRSLDPYLVSFRYIPFVSRAEAKEYTSLTSRLIFEG